MSPAKDPLLEKAFQTMPSHLFKSALKIRSNDLFGTETLKIGVDASTKTLIGKLMTQHMQDPGTFVVQVPIKQLKALIVVSIVYDWATIGAIFSQIAIFLQEHRILELIYALVMLNPHTLKIGCKTFI